MLRRQEGTSSRGMPGSGPVWRRASTLGLAAVCVFLLALSFCRESPTGLRQQAPVFEQAEASIFLYSCAVAVGGQAYCWGDDEFGELGVGSVLPQYLCVAGSSCTTTPRAVVGSVKFASISAGFDHACGLTTSGGTAYCWGDNHNGQLGTRDTLWSDVPTPVTGGLAFAAVSAGVYHTCGLTTGGKAYCWGDDYDGALGNGKSGTTEYVNPAPVAVSGGLVFKVLGTGNEHSCGLTSGGAVYCWGYNYHGDLGNDNPNPSLTPVAVKSSLTFDTLAVGPIHECALTSGGLAYCWGSNDRGELGDSTTIDSSTPVAVSGGLRFVSISAGQSDTCGVTTQAQAYCWGYNLYGQVGNATAPRTGLGVLTPVRVSGSHRWRSVTSGYIHSCGVTTNGMVYCWGDGSNGELGVASIEIGKGAKDSIPVHVLFP